jgi:8-oxo-dGTP diphosphatase
MESSREGTSARRCYVGIRPIRLDDAESIELLASDWRVAATCNIAHPLPPGSGLAFVRDAQIAWRAGDWYAFAITADNEFAGVTLLERASSHADVSFWLGRRFWGQGVATVALTNSHRRSLGDI